MKHPPAPPLPLGSRWRSAMLCERVLHCLERCQAEGCLRCSRTGSSAGRGGWGLSLCMAGCAACIAATALARSQSGDAGVPALTCQIGSRSCCSRRQGGAIRPLALSGRCPARLQSELPSDFNRAVCTCRYVLGLVYPAYVTVNALESPGTQDDHHVRFTLCSVVFVTVLHCCSFLFAPPLPPRPHLGSFHAPLPWPGVHSAHETTRLTSAVLMYRSG